MAFERGLSRSPMREFFSAPSRLQPVAHVNALRKVPLQRKAHNPSARCDQLHAGAMNEPGASTVCRDGDRCIFIGIALEQHDMAAFFGGAYRACRARVPMILPFKLGKRTDAGSATRYADK